ncbi:hypothetical protein FOA43_000385 [Brettanomyces nanus]|uniref:PAS domain-containing protein n=1 Tax=Eeniella nana TaxID=13502 RepID=A0A875RN21_EENNA|nr:uncharacterized protein FOA43_000385 [Brettanomyces nanus]QPG73080.1 hypothetical protein FOA43_000385 [Brettanomyces nanus]
MSNSLGSLPGWHVNFVIPSTCSVTTVDPAVTASNEGFTKIARTPFEKKKSTSRKDSIDLSLESMSQVGQLGEFGSTSAIGTTNIIRLLDSDSTAFSVSGQSKKLQIGGKVKKKRRKYRKRKKKADSPMKMIQVTEQTQKHVPDSKQEAPTRFHSPSLPAGSQNLSAASFVNFEDTSKAILPFSLSVATLNKLLSHASGVLPPSQVPTFQLPPKPQSHLASSQIDPAFNSSTIRVINPDNTSDNANVSTLSDHIPTEVSSHTPQYSAFDSGVDLQSTVDPEEPLEFNAPSSRRPSLASISASSHTLNVPHQSSNQELLSAPASIDSSVYKQKQLQHSSRDSSPHHQFPNALDRKSPEGSSDNSSGKKFMSTTANDEYVKLTDLLNTNPPSPSQDFLEDFSGHIDTDDDYHISLPFIEIGIDDNSMRTSYTNNTTPNSYIYNGEHSHMPNTAREIPHDLQEDDDFTSPLIMRHVIKKPDDIYLTSIVKAYQYPKAYHALIAYLKQRFDKNQLIEVAKCMAKYRPSFIAATKSLYENDLIFTERSFQRALLEYEQLISLSPSPTIIWRRTGEIVALTNGFATMTGYSKMSLLSKRTFIVELMDDESTLKYFQSFSEMAFGDLNATYLTDCNLRKADDNDYLKCCCVWTIKRDVFDIPMLIVGQFLPVLS